MVNMADVGLLDARCRCMPKTCMLHRIVQRQAQHTKGSYNRERQPHANNCIEFGKQKSR